MDIRKIRTCSHLLPDPGGEVVRELLDEVERLRSQPHWTDLAFASLGALRDTMNDDDVVAVQRFLQRALAAKEEE